MKGKETEKQRIMNTNLRNIGIDSEEERKRRVGEERRRGREQRIAE